MTTSEIAEAIAKAARPFPFLGEITVAALRALVRSELGDEKILDEFRPRGDNMAKAVPPAVILHVISGNTPHAGLQSLIRGLLLHSLNLCKVPRGGLPQLNAFSEELPQPLGQSIEIAESLSEEWLSRADVVVAFGSDETIEDLRSRIRPDQIFLPHGHRVSFGVIFDDPHLESPTAAASDASLYDQQGCLSPHLFYVRETSSLSARRYAGALALAMESFEKDHPRRALSTAESSRVTACRETSRFLQANGAGVELWESAGSTAWTVIYEDDPAFRVSPLNRVVYVKPLPIPLKPALDSVRSHLSTVGIWPCKLQLARELEDLGVSRICPIGRMQFPPLEWHPDGIQPLASMVSWLDYEGR